MGHSCFAWFIHFCHLLLKMSKRGRKKTFTGAQMHSITQSEDLGSV